MTLDLAPNEVRILAGLGITSDDLAGLLHEKPFAEGSYAMLFEPKNNNLNLVVKAWKNPSRDAARASNEHVALRLLRRGSTVHVPRVRGFVQSSAVLLEEKALGERFEQPDAEAVGHLADALASLHSIMLNKYGDTLHERKPGTRLDLLLERVASLRERASSFPGGAETVHLILRALNAIERDVRTTPEAFSSRSFTLVHFDLNPGNILYAKQAGAITLIDWEQASAGDNAMDIAKLFLKCRFSAEQRRVFLAHYEPALRERDSSFETRLSAYELYAIANSLLWRLRVLKDQPERPLPEGETQFYDRVESNFKQETTALAAMLPV